MARRYNRDKYGRFAPKGSGATARGGRLKTASGKKRATQTMKAQSQQRSGTLTPGKKKPSVSAAPASNVRATGRLNRPPVSNAVKGTAGRLGPKNAIKAGPKSPRTKMSKAIDNVIAKGKDLRGAKDKLQDLKKQADALRGKMNKADKSRAQKAFDKPSVTDKRSRDFLGKLTKEGRKQDPDTGGKKKRRGRKR